jgi:hypothetical protein
MRNFCIKVWKNELLKWENILHGSLCVRKVNILLIGAFVGLQKCDVLCGNILCLGNILSGKHSICSRKNFKFPLLQLFFLADVFHSCIDFCLQFFSLMGAVTNHF